MPPPQEGCAHGSDSSAAGVGDLADQKQDSQHRRSVGGSICRNRQDRLGPRGRIEEPFGNEESIWNSNYGFRF